MVSLPNDPTLPKTCHRCEGTNLLSSDEGDDDDDDDDVGVDEPMFNILVVSSTVAVVSWCPCVTMGSGV